MIFARNHYAWTWLRSASVRFSDCFDSFWNFAQNMLSFNASQRWRRRRKMWKRKIKTRTHSTRIELMLLVPSFVSCLARCCCPHAVIVLLLILVGMRRERKVGWCTHTRTRADCCERRTTILLMIFFFFFALPNMYSMQLRISVLSRFFAERLSRRYGGVLKTNQPVARRMNSGT